MSPRLPKIKESNLNGMKSVFWKSLDKNLILSSKFMIKIKEKMTTLLLVLWLLWILIILIKLKEFLYLNIADSRNWWKESKTSSLRWPTNLLTTAMERSLDTLTLQFNLCLSDKLKLHYKTNTCNQTWWVTRDTKRQLIKRQSM